MRFSYLLAANKTLNDRDCRHTKINGMPLLALLRNNANPTLDCSAPNRACNPTSGV